MLLSAANAHRSVRSLVGIARGEQEFFDQNGIATATEAAKSNALMRCCKDLGIASELWDPRFIREFKAKHCIEVFVEDSRTKKKCVLVGCLLKCPELTLFLGRSSGAARTSPPLDTPTPRLRAPHLSTHTRHCILHSIAYSPLYRRLISCAATDRARIVIDISSNDSTTKQNYTRGATASWSYRTGE